MDRLLSDQKLTSCAIIGENGSTDGTREAFQGSNVRLVDTSFLGTIARRLEKMAKGRQHLADIARDYSPLAYCVLDLDNTLSITPDTESIFRATEKLRSGPYFAHSAQSRPFYYDILAFEKYNNSYIDITSTIRTAMESCDPAQYYRTFRDNVYSLQRDLTSISPIECISAFNGFCLYRPEAFRSGSYVQGADLSICEHVNFHRSIHRATGQVMQINPELCVAMPPEHGPTSAINFFFARAMKYARRTLFSRSNL
jgi:hypothetical protein